LFGEPRRTGVLERISLTDILDVVVIESLFRISLYVETFYLYPPRPSFFLPLFTNDVEGVFYELRQC
jgi:hypothetical protein